MTFEQELQQLLAEPVENGDYREYYFTRNYIRLLEKYAQSRMDAICAEIGLLRPQLHELVGGFDRLAHAIPIRVLELLGYDAKVLEECYRRDLAAWQAAADRITSFPDQYTEIAFSILRASQHSFEELGFAKGANGRTSGSIEEKLAALEEQARLHASERRRRIYIMNLLPLLDVRIEHKDLRVQSDRPSALGVWVEPLSVQWARSPAGIREAKMKRQSARQRAKARGEAMPEFVPPPKPSEVERIQAIRFVTSPRDLVLPEWLRESPRIVGALAERQARLAAAEVAEHGPVQPLRGVWTLRP